MNRTILSGVLAALLAACGGAPGSAQDAAAPAANAPAANTSVEQRPPNATGQTPAFPGQTRAPEMKAGVDYQVTSLAKGLENPWGLAFLPDGRLLVSERAGRLRILGADGVLSPAATGLPPVDAVAQGGLLGLAVDPAFTRNGLIYWSYAERQDGLTHTSVARGRLTGDPAAPALEDVKVILRQAPALDSVLHYGGRLVFAPDGTLFVTTGERSILPGRMQAQRLDGLLGKVVRISPDGSVPRDNPFVGKPGVRPEIWSYGHRNLQGAAINPATGKLWTVEHGARGGDEVNIPGAGRDYGWPTITYGVEYSGKPIGEGITQKSGMEQPVYFWDPVIAPSGMAFYSAGLFPAWKGSLFIGGLSGKHLVRLTLSGDRVMGEERLLTELKQRIRDVIVGPDGALYVATDSASGEVLKLTPKPATAP